ncbi:MAG: pitrilysin family protein [Armatimonas sp.]
MTRRHLLLGSLFAGVLSTAYATEPPKPERFVLDGGTELLVFPDPNATSAALAALVRLGPEDEGAEQGIAALLAHLVGTEAEGRGATQIQRDVESFGAIGSEYDGLGLTLWAVCDPMAFNEAARTLLVNVLARPTVAPDAFAVARDDLNRALQRQSEDLFHLTIDGLRSRVFGTSVALLGTERSLAALTPAKIEAFHERVVRPSRTTLIAAGKIEPEAVHNQVTALLGAAGWLELSAAPKLHPIPPLAAMPVLRDQEIPVHAPAKAVALGLLWPGLSASDIQRVWPACMLLDSLLGGGKGARLFKVLRDKESLGYEVNTELVPGRGASLWAAYIVGNASPETMKDRLRGAIADAAKGNFTEEELNRARAYLNGQRLRREQRLLGKVRALAADLTVGLDPLTPRPVEVISLDEINALARQLLSTNPALVYSL